MGAEEVVPQIPVKEQIKMQKRSVDRSRRALEREAKKLERERKKMLTQIKKLAEKGQTTGAKMMAKDIVRAKNQQQKLEQFVGQLNAVSLRIGSCASLNELGDAMANCAKAMTLVSSKLDAKKLAHMAKEIAKQDMQLDMKSDMMSEILDSLDEGNEEEENKKIEIKTKNARLKKGVKYNQDFIIICGPLFNQLRNNYQIDYIIKMKKFQELIDLSEKPTKEEKKEDEKPKEKEKEDDNENKKAIVDRNNEKACNCGKCDECKKMKNKAMDDKNDIDNIIKLIDCLERNIQNIEKKR